MQGMKLKPKFNLGSVYVSRGAQSSLGIIEINTALIRHASGDWGNVSDGDKRENDHRLSSADGFRLLSSYTSISGVKFWVITDNIKDDPVTTVLLPDEY